jgi:2-keto-4-pentenoate hydratase/2-oxohepta-3-ene-1,7-dioic acid hydratase in catechol pathway
MRLASFIHKEKRSFGVLEASGVIDLGARLSSEGLDLKAIIKAGRLAEMIELGTGLQPDIALEDVHFLPVIPNSEKILCVGLNYDAHRVETGRDKTMQPTLFTRFADTLVGHEGNIVLPRASAMLDYEGELAVVIGREGRHISEESAMDHVAGYSCFNDASVRDWQRHTSQFTPGKNFPATGGFGPALVTAESVPNVNDLAIQTRLNGQVVQDANTSEFIFDIPTLIAYISTFTCLRAGDVISTGTPSGVGFKRVPPLFMQDGDSVDVEIAGIGTLTNRVVAE